MSLSLTHTRTQKHTRDAPLRNINALPQFMASHSLTVQNKRVNLLFGSLNEAFYYTDY